MIYFLHGKDTETSRVKLNTLVESLRTKKPDATYVRFDEETFEPENIDQYISGQGLFEQKLIVVFDRILTNKETKKCILDRLTDIANSDNIFLVWEESVDAATRKKFEKVSEKVQESVHSEKIKIKEFNIFDLSDALGNRNAKNLWILYQKAKMHNISDEEIHGILLWLAKSMLLAEKSNSAKEAGLNPFVYRKASGFRKNYSSRELQDLSLQLVTLYHEARRGRAPLSVSLEQFTLSL